MSVSGTAPFRSSGSSAASMGTVSQPSTPQFHHGTGCWFECGFTGTLLNIGNARSPKWVCAACNSSRKAIDKQAKDATPENRKALNNLKLNLENYKATVRDNRLQLVMKQGHQNSLQARSLYAQRAQQIDKCLVTYVTTAEVVNGVSMNHDVQWMDELEYIAYHKFTKGLEHKQATVIVYYHYMCIHNIPIYIYIYIYTHICVYIYIYYKVVYHSIYIYM